MPYVINPKYEHVLPLVENIESHCQSSTRILYDQRNVICLVNFEGHDYVVKAFKTPNFINRIAYRYFRPSKAKRSFEYSLILGDEITPEPIAYIEDMDKLLLGKSYYISQHFDYDHTIHEVLSNKELSDRQRILEEFADFTHKLHEAKILHHDYSHGNILIKKQSLVCEQHYSFKIIDLNRMKFKNLDLDSRLENFARIKADDLDLEIIINRYSEQTKTNPKEALEKAKFFRDDFYSKRAIKNKLRGKSES